MIFQTLYTLGYTGIPFALLKQAVQQVNVLVVDTRFKAASRAAQWRYGYMAEQLGEHYLHLPALGNENYKGGDIKIADPATGVPAVLKQLQQRSVILLCVCAELDTCHRLVVAKLVQQAGDCSVKHLTKADLEAWVAPVQPFDVLPDNDQKQYGLPGVEMPDKIIKLKQKSLF